MDIIGSAARFRCFCRNRVCGKKVRGALSFSPAPPPALVGTHSGKSETVLRALSVSAATIARITFPLCIKKCVG